MTTGDHQQADLCYRRAQAMHEAGGDAINAARTQVNRAILRLQQGDLTQALELLDGVAPLFRRLRDRPWQARVANNQGVILASLDRPTEAVSTFDYAAGLHQANGEWANAIVSLQNAADVLLDQGHQANAQQRLQQALDLLAKLPSPPQQLRQRQQALQQRVAG